MILIALFLATCFLAYSNGANDNFKGVASLYGCRAASTPTAIHGRDHTFAINRLHLSRQALLKKFSGKGWCPTRWSVGAIFTLLCWARRSRCFCHLAGLRFRHDGIRRIARGWLQWVGSEFCGARQRPWRHFAQPALAIALAVTLSFQASTCLRGRKEGCVGRSGGTVTPFQPAPRCRCDPLFHGTLS